MAEYLGGTSQDRFAVTTEASTLTGNASLNILGVRVDAVQIPDAIARLEEWIRNHDICRYVAVTGMHGVTEAQHDPAFKDILNSAGLVVPDGMPLVWLSRLKGFPLKRRVYGPELMMSFFESTEKKGYRHFLYGGTPCVLEQLARAIQRRFPGTIVAGAYSPPFRDLTQQEDSQAVAMINNAVPDVVWVGLSTPKQERWMHQHRERLRVPVLLGVGAAFDINAGMKKQAPRWMREHGLEWLFRLLQEPRRLWKRYLVYGSKFAGYILLEFLNVRKFD